MKCINRFYFETSLHWENLNCAAVWKVGGETCFWFVRNTKNFIMFCKGAFQRRMKLSLNIGQKSKHPVMIKLSLANSSIHCCDWLSVSILLSYYLLKIIFKAHVAGLQCLHSDDEQNPDREQEVKCRYNIHTIYDSANNWAGQSVPPTLVTCPYIHVWAKCYYYYIFN